MNKRYNIGAVSKITGLSTHVIRAWERRYGLVSPLRSEKSKRRLYSDEDITRLSLLRQATSMGFNISTIAKMQLNELDTLIRERGRSTEQKVVCEKTDDVFERLIESSISAIKNFQPSEFEDILSYSTVEYGQLFTVENLIIPVSKIIGECWNSGDLRIAHEHMATEIIRIFLLKIINRTHTYGNAPTAVVATPSGQQHEIGALITASLAAIEGWRIIYLGADLPAEEITMVVNRIKPRLLVLSIVYPPDDMNLRDELLKIRKHIRTDTCIFTGGRAIESYLSTLIEINAACIRDFTEFRLRLKEIQKSLHEKKK